MDVAVPKPSERLSETVPVASADSAMARGTKLLIDGKPDVALAAFDEALAIDPSSAEVLLNRGVALQRMKRNDEALASYWQAAQLGNRSAIWINAANALNELGRGAEAFSVIVGALRREPNTGEAWQTLATILLSQKQRPAAEAALRRAAALSPQAAVPRIRLAEVMALDDRLESALQIFGEARDLDPKHPAAHSGYAQALVGLGRLDEAAKHFQRVFELEPEHLDSHLGTARHLLLGGDLKKGWEEYEWRRKKPTSKLPKLSGPEWDGSPLKGKTILVYAEQGLGDVIQFARYIPILAAQGGRIIFAIQPELEPLFEGLEGAAEVITRSGQLPPYDFHIPLLTIPKFLDIALDRVPAKIPYIRPQAPRERLPVPLGARLKVGIVWAGSPKHGNDQNRSMSLEEFLPIAGIPGVALYSLQAGPRASDIAKFAHPALIHDLSPLLRDFAVTASFITQLDLVVTVDTSVAHLAGAMGKPVWVLLPYAPDWRWLLHREDTPWYPTMRLFRQQVPGQWAEPVTRIVTELGQAAARRAPYGSEGDVLFHTVFHRDGKPRAHLGAPRNLMLDPGVRYLVLRERSGVGYEYASRCFIDAHLPENGIFIDVGAHWGLMSLQAATRWPGQVHALAIEPLPANLPYLRGWVAANQLKDSIEIVEGAVGAKAGRGSLRPESTMGHSLIPAQDGPIEVVTVDGLLAARPHLQNRPVVVKIDVEGSELDVLQGMAELFKSGQVAAVIWERGHTYSQPGGAEKLAGIRQIFSKLGFTAWRFASEDAAGQLVPYIDDGRVSNVFELAPDQEPQPVYGAERLPAESQPADFVADAMTAAGAQIEAGGRAQKAGKLGQALTAYAAAAFLDQQPPDLYNNVGVALRTNGRNAAAEAAYLRAVQLKPHDAGMWSNLGNLLRERGKLGAAEAAHRRALALQPNVPGFVYNAALVYRDDGRPQEALREFEKVLQLRPDDAECRFDLALSYLQQGDYGRGFPAYESRWGLARNVTRRLNLPKWDGGALDGRSLFLADEQGYGDVVMFVRFIGEVKRRGAGRIILECQPELMRLFALLPDVDEVRPRGAPVPACDLTVPLMSLPGLLGITLDTLPAKVPYLVVPEPKAPLPKDDRLKVGIVWASKPRPRDRSCPLKKLLPLFGDPRLAIYSLQVGDRAADLKELATDGLITDLAPRLHDFAETAAVVSSLDLVITVDTVMAHLAGGLGIPTFVLLRYTSDWRWFDRRVDSPWYPTVKLFRQDQTGRWDEPLRLLARELDAFTTARRQPLPAIVTVGI